MKKYLIFLPGSATDVSGEDKAAVGEAEHAVICEAKDAGVYVFGGGINGDAALMAADDAVKKRADPQSEGFEGGLCALERPSRYAAVQWPGKIVKACRCSQELREFGYDRES
jgi:hypothetical protein